MLVAINGGPDPLLCISARAEAGKTAVAHCVLKALMDARRDSSPRRLVMRAVPTRALREEVVMDLCKLKAVLASALR